jgi:hypothetical protein
MQTYISNDGRSWPVSDKWPINDARSLVRDNARHTLESIIAKLHGTDYREFFGPDATLDQCHGNNQKTDICDCEFHVFFDHYEARTAADAIGIALDKGEPAPAVKVKIHPHKALFVCKHHAHHSDVREHHAAVMAECQDKENARMIVAQQMGIDSKDIVWRYDERRQLVLSHPALIDPGVKAAVGERVSKALPKLAFRIA